MSDKKLPNGRTPAEAAHDVVMVLFNQGWLTNGTNDKRIPDNIPYIVKEIMDLEELFTQQFERHVVG
ncbi:hypothetical protein ETAE_1610 [Edwardsiella piscicida]|uniref:Uncharacterized protein n=3 Tax=Edwardsiella TaxID=635 RepID=A0AAQ3C367_EDWPI|nr:MULTISPECIES: hypothetical protein [Edwardsiella]ACY84451.1 hypothetical protein ETAE_1610 [Edwardsiella tarda EIB202]EFE22798.1 hypothetical protein EDWATA_02192 [Edwardsiella tarda ATCC 23685]EKS7794446.1 hypothetical protein [Edwardsiella piscicida]ELM3729375.1 hypothetical protein [Edwardsiella piscicida]ELV7536585.1 hypothetical protein [Edwardsiella piscicida]